MIFLGPRYFFKIDLRSGYRRTGMKEAYEWKTTYKTKYELHS